MTGRQRAIAGAAASVGAVAFTYAWYNTLLFVPFSERLWSLFNLVLGGDKPGWASDLEFLTVIAGSGIVCYSAARFVTRTLMRHRSPRAE
jgi:hypothetical protein